MATPDGWIVDSFECPECGDNQVHVYSKWDEFDLKCCGCDHLINQIRIPEE